MVVLGILRQWLTVADGEWLGFILTPCNCLIFGGCQTRRGELDSR